MPFSASRTSYYLDVITGRRSGIGASLVRAGLTVPAYCLWLPVSTGARLFKQYAKTPYRPPCPVISVGNITAGGTGKTPMVEWLAARLKAEHKRPAVLSRGYRATSGTSNDEAQVLSQHMSDVPVLTGKDRAASAQSALEQKLANCFILDDGFQHYAMARDLDIVLIDCLLPFGGGYLLPRGLLREPVGALQRADLIVLTRSDQISEERKHELRNRLEAIDSSLPIAEAVHKPTELVNEPLNLRENLDFISGKKVLIFSGIGNPNGFERTVRGLAGQIVEHHRFRDHHRYFDHELTDLAAQAEKQGCDAVLTTEKDNVKIGRCWKSAVPLYALRVEFEVTAGEEILTQLLKSALTTQYRQL